METILHTVSIFREFQFHPCTVGPLIYGPRRVAAPSWCPDPGGFGSVFPQRVIGSSPRSSVLIKINDKKRGEKRRENNIIHLHPCVVSFAVDVPIDLQAWALELLCYAHMTAQLLPLFWRG